MAEINLTTDDLTILGGPSSINVDLDIGPTGDRGSFIFVGSGKPDIAPNFIPSGYTLKTYDMYINLLTSDDEYMFLYQYLNNGTNLTWTKLMKLTPNMFSRNYGRTFVDGETTINVPVTAIVPSYSELLSNITAENFNVQCNILSQDPVSFGLSVGEIVVDPSTSTQVLPITINAISYNSATSTWEPVTTNKTVHLYITVV